MNMNEGSFLVQDDNGIRKILVKLNEDTNIIEFFVNHNIKSQVFSQYILAINYDQALDESREHENLTEYPKYPEISDIPPMHDVSGDIDDIKSNASENEIGEKDSQNDNGDNLIHFDDNSRVPIEKKHRACFSINDQKPYFSLGMLLNLETLLLSMLLQEELV